MSSLSPLKKSSSFAPQIDLLTPWHHPETEAFDDDNYDSGAVDDVAVVDDDAYCEVDQDTMLKIFFITLTSRQCS